MSQRRVTILVGVTNFIGFPERHGEKDRSLRTLVHSELKTSDVSCCSGLHDHDFFEVHATIEGASKFVTGGRCLCIVPGDVLLIDGAIPHGFLAPTDGQFVRYVVHFLANAVAGYGGGVTDPLELMHAENADSFFRIHLHGPALEKTVAILEGMSNPNGAVRFTAETLKCAHLAELLIHLNSQAAVVDPDCLPVDHRSFVRTRPVVSFINRHIGEDLSLRTLSGRFNFSTQHLSHLFKRATGYSVRRYVILRRIAAAKLLLRRNCPAQEASARVGFRDYSHFARTFRQHVGVAPSSFPNRRTEDEDAVR